MAIVERIRNFVDDRVIPVEDALDTDPQARCAPRSR